MDLEANPLAVCKTLAKFFIETFGEWAASERHPGPWSACSPLRRWKRRTRTQEDISAATV